MLCFLSRSLDLYVKTKENILFKCNLLKYLFIFALPEDNLFLKAFSSCHAPWSLLQTGTLTEDGLDLWGIQRVENAR